MVLSTYKLRGKFEQLKNKKESSWSCKDNVLNLTRCILKILRVSTYFRGSEQKKRIHIKSDKANVVKDNH